MMNPLVLTPDQAFHENIYMRLIHSSRTYCALLSVLRVQQ